MKKEHKSMIVEMVEHIKTNYDIDVTQTKRRFEPIVISRAALFNACRGLMTSTRLGGHFEMNHATILHHQKNHDGLLMMSYYRQLYFELMKIRSKYDEVAKDYQDDVLKQLENLKNEFNLLKWKYEELKKKHEKVIA